MNTISLTDKTEIKSLEEEKPTIVNILRNKSYMLAFGGQILNIIASILAGMTFSYLIYDITGNAALMSLMGIIAAVPTILIILFAGVIVDRIEQRKLILITIGFRLIIFILFLLCFVLRDYLIQEYVIYEQIPYGGSVKVIVSDYTHFIWPMYLALFISNAGASLYWVTLSTYSKFIVKKNDLLIANSFTATVTQIASVIGPILAGVLITFSYLYSFIISVCIMSLAVIVSLFLLLKGVETPKVEIKEVSGFKNHMKKVFVDIREGMNAIKDEPKILFITSVYVIFNFITCMINGPYTVIVQGKMALNATWIGAISATMSAIAVVSSLIVLKIGKINRKLIIVIIFLVLQTFGMFLFAFNRNPWILITVNVIPLGIVNGLANIPSGTLRQEKIPHEKLGRVMSSVLLFINIANLLGNGLVTAISNYVDPKYIVLSGAIMCTFLAIGSAILFFTKRNLRCSDYEDTDIVVLEKKEKKEQSSSSTVTLKGLTEVDMTSNETESKPLLENPVPTLSLE